MNVTLDMPAAATSGRPRRILVVEDADGVRDVIRRLLERQGYTVLTAANASEAARLFDEHASIDVLLSDVVMPGASGPELTRRLAAGRPWLKVILMSGYAESMAEQYGELAPGIAFLQKPFSSAALKEKIGDVIGGR